MNLRRVTIVVNGQPELGNRLFDSGTQFSYIFVACLGNQSDKLVAAIAFDFADVCVELPAHNPTVVFETPVEQRQNIARQPPRITVYAQPHVRLADELEDFWLEPAARDRDRINIPVALVRRESSGPAIL